MLRKDEKLLPSAAEGWVAEQNGIGIYIHSAKIKELGQQSAIQGCNLDGNRLLGDKAFKSFIALLPGSDHHERATYTCRAT